MRKVVMAILLLTVVGCQSTEPVVITKVVYNITEVPHEKAYEKEAERRAIESPTDLLDPFFVRLQYYLQVEKEINLIYDKLETSIYSGADKPKIKLLPVKGKIKGATFQSRANIIISEFILNRIEAYDFDNEMQQVTHSKTWFITPKLKIRNGKISLQLELKDENNLIIPVVGASSDITDYFFFNYVDGIRFD